MTKYERRSDDQRIQELEVRIAGIRSRAERRKARAKPEVRLAITAVRALDKAIGQSQEPELRKVFEDARALLGGLQGIPAASAPREAPAKPRRGRRAKAVAG